MQTLTAGTTKNGYPLNRNGRKRRGARMGACILGGIKSRLVLLPIIGWDEPRSLPSKGTLAALTSTETDSCRSVVTRPTRVHTASMTWPAMCGNGRSQTIQTTEGRWFVGADGSAHHRRSRRCFDTIGPHQPGTPGSVSGVLKTLIYRRRRLLRCFQARQRRQVSLWSQVLQVWCRLDRYRVGRRMSREAPPFLRDRCSCPLSRPHDPNQGRSLVRG